VITTEAVFTDVQLSERWGCSLRSVQNLARAGSLAGFKVGKAWRFREGAVLAHESADERSQPHAEEFTSLRRRAS
jgi:hypothetical protein